MQHSLILFTTKEQPSYQTFLPSFLPLGTTAQGELWPPEQSASKADCLVSKQFSFYGVMLLASRPIPNLEDQSIPLRLAPIP
jgi:hypothetical protein